MRGWWCRGEARATFSAPWWKLQACATWTCMGFAHRGEFFSHFLMMLPTATRLRLTIIIQLRRVTCTSSGVYRDHGGAVISFSCTRSCKTRDRVMSERDEAWIIRDKLNRFITVQIAKSQALIITDAWQLFLRELIEELHHWIRSGKFSKSSSLLRVQ